MKEYVMDVDALVHVNVKIAKNVQLVGESKLLRFKRHNISNIYL